MVSVRQVWLRSPAGEWIIPPTQADDVGGTVTARTGPGTSAPGDPTVRRFHVYAGGEEGWLASCAAPMETARLNYRHDVAGLDAVDGTPTQPHWPNDWPSLVTLNAGILNPIELGNTDYDYLHYLRPTVLRNRQNLDYHYVAPRQMIPTVTPVLPMWQVTNDAYGSVVESTEPSSYGSEPTGYLRYNQTYVYLDIDRYKYDKPELFGGLNVESVEILYSWDSYVYANYSDLETALVWLDGTSMSAYAFRPMDVAEYPPGIDVGQGFEPVMLSDSHVTLCELEPTVPTELEGIPGPYETPIAWQATASGAEVITITGETKIGLTAEVNSPANAWTFPYPEPEYDHIGINVGPVYWYAYCSLHIGFVAIYLA